ncbi:uncharacterized protein LOC125228598 [Leguminivora glycinivorella]|uniref:uncharacterized protein LOC125228598 n=1 Tax=Leguminivora glycinivorella TaxID=1035111 RepID=UPI00200D6656|nr:uncharacterized protein LOC125228598 [Leguminivora glycinivorella]
MDLEDGEAQVQIQICISTFEDQAGYFRAALVVGVDQVPVEGVASVLGGEVRAPVVEDMDLEDGEAQVQIQICISTFEDQAGYFRAALVVGVDQVPVEGVASVLGGEVRAPVVEDMDLEDGEAQVQIQICISTFEDQAGYFRAALVVGVDQVPVEGVASVLGGEVRAPVVEDMDLEDGEAQVQIQICISTFEDQAGYFRAALVVGVDQVPVEGVASVLGGEVRAPVVEDMDLEDGEAQVPQIPETAVVGWRERTQRLRRQRIRWRLELEFPGTVHGRVGLELTWKVFRRVGF